jgi:gas vesicle protein
MFDNEDTRFASFAATFALGALVGAAVALIFAPMPGKKMQRQIRNKWEDGKDSLESVVENFESVVEGVQNAAKSVKTAARKFTK